jgi:hypothetical protein
MPRPLFVVRGPLYKGILSAYTKKDPDRNSGYLKPKVEIGYSLATDN